MDFAPRAVPVAADDIVVVGRFEGIQFGGDAVCPVCGWSIHCLPLPARPGDPCPMPQDWRREKFPDAPEHCPGILRHFASDNA